MEKAVNKTWQQGNHRVVLDDISNRGQPTAVPQFGSHNANLIWGSHFLCLGGSG